VNARKPEILKHISDIVCANLDPLLLVKELYEQTLIYARYGARSAANNKTQKQEAPA